MFRESQIIICHIQTYLNNVYASSVAFEQNSSEVTGKTMTIFFPRRLWRLGEKMSLFCPEAPINFILKQKNSRKRYIALIKDHKKNL